MLAAASTAARRAGSALPRAAAAFSAAAAPAAGHPPPSAHAWLDYAHPGQPGARDDYRNADTDFGFHLSGAFFERPHVRRYSDAWQGDGKLFIADGKTLPAEQTVPVFHVPCAGAYALEGGAEVDVNARLGEKGAVTLVTVAMSGLGLPNQDMSAWQSAFLTAFGGSPAHRLVNVKYMDGFEYFFAPGAFNGMVAGGVLPEAAPHTVVAYEPYHYNITWFTELAAMHNRSYGFAYLVDKEGNIVWRAHGPPAMGELDAMKGVAKALA